MTGARAPEPHLLFVYDVDGGLANAARDVWHRLNSPQTYPCPLCKLTYGVRGMNPRWRRFIESLPIAVTFLHRDRFRADHAASSWRYVELPVALLEIGRELEELVSAEEFRRTRSIDGLIGRVQRALDAHAVPVISEQRRA